MAWKQCEYCPKKINGYGNLLSHQRQAHPQEYERAKARRQVHQSEYGVELAKRNIALRADLLQALSLADLPPLSRGVLEEAARGYPFRTPGGQTIEENLAWELEWAEKRLQEAKATGKEATSC